MIVIAAVDLLSFVIFSFTFFTVLVLFFCYFQTDFKFQFFYILE